MENPGEVDIKYKLWDSQRGMLVVICMLFLTVLAVVDALVGKINETVLLGFTGAVTGGLLWFFKDKGAEARQI